MGTPQKSTHITTENSRDRNKMIGRSTGSSSCCGTSNGYRDPIGSNARGSCRRRSSLSRLRLATVRMSSERRVTLLRASHQVVRVPGKGGVEDNNLRRPCCLSESQEHAHTFRLFWYLLRFLRWMVEASASRACIELKQVCKHSRNFVFEAFCGQSWYNLPSSTPPLIFKPLNLKRCPTWWVTGT